MATPEAETPTPSARHIIAFDYGLRRIGAAVGNELLGSASAIAPLRARDGVPDWKAVQRLLQTWQPRRILIGLPLNMDGSASDMSARAERFARRLEGRFLIPCEMIDERLSSAAARAELAHGQRLSDAAAAAIDSEAARIILEAWFAARATTRRARSGS